MPVIYGKSSVIGLGLDRLFDVSSGDESVRRNWQRLANPLSALARQCGRPSRDPCTRIGPVVRRRVLEIIHGAKTVKECGIWLVLCVSRCAFVYGLVVCGLPRKWRDILKTGSARSWNVGSVKKGDS